MAGGKSFSIRDLHPDSLLTEHEVSAYLGRSLGTLRNDRHLRRGVPFIKTGAQVRYRWGAVREYLDRNTVDTQATA